MLPLRSTRALVRGHLRASHLAAVGLVGALGWACVPVGPPTFPPPEPAIQARNRAAGDPYGGRFPLEEALRGLPEGKELVATLVTDAGDIECVLNLQGTPLTVANFVGLARGLRPFQETPGGPWVTKPYYDGLTWHRAKERQFVQVGERPGGPPGFVIQDERTVGDAFDHAGVMALANTGEPHSGTAQFFITTDKLRHLDGVHAIFGWCQPSATIRDVERRTVRGENPTLQSVTITRR